MKRKKERITQAADRPVPPVVARREDDAGSDADGSEVEAAHPAAEPETDERTLAEDLDRLKAREDELLRAVAELTNANRRRRQEMETSISFAQEALVRDLLPVLDDFDRAIAAFPPNDEDPVRAGVALVHERLKRTLEREGLEPIDPEGEPFDPARHEAIAHREQPGVASGRVLEVAQIGYRFRGRVVRPARVVVS